MTTSFIFILLLFPNLSEQIKRFPRKKRYAIGDLSDASEAMAVYLNFTTEMLQTDDQVMEVPDNFNIPGTNHINDWVVSIKHTDDGNQDNLELQLRAANHKHQYTQKLLSGSLAILKVTVPLKNSFINENQVKNGILNMSDFINQQRSIEGKESR